MVRKKEEIEDTSTEAVNTNKVVIQEVQRPRRKVSFEQWASARGVKNHHKGGLKAHVSNHKVPRSYEEWDRVFSDY